MKTKKSIFASITGGLTSAAPILFACCKSGACVGVCASPVASLFGVSSAAIAGSPWVGVLEPILIALSAVSFTVSYYQLYVLPKTNCASGDVCACAPDPKELRKQKITKFVFWFGLILSIGFLSYFEYNKYQQATSNSECGTECSVPAEEETCGSSCDSTGC
ncbi:MAG: hypothetical protein IT236_13395 [Bacteroidia bacterium]|nr:hypothetical protein [Bacteroidia bacterium]